MSDFTAADDFELPDPNPETSTERALVAETESVTGKSLSPTRQAWKRFWRNRGAAISAILLLIIIVIAVLAPITARYGVNDAVFPISEGPNQFLTPRSVAWFGTDDLGRDLYSRLLYGVRTSVYLGLMSAILSVGLGTLIGATAGMNGGRLDDFIMRVTDLTLAFPFLVTVILIRQLLGGVKFLRPIIGDISSIRFIIFLFAVLLWPLVARLVRSQVITLKEREFVEASRAAGASNRRIIVSHLLPNAIGPIIVAGTLAVVAAILGEATLSFFGFGPQPGSDSTSLGKIIEGAGSAARAGYWWLVVFPGGALVLIAVCVNFIGDGLRDAFDPKMDGGR